jgi:Zn-dependent peptidase ImmA (M78 family)
MSKRYAELARQLAAMLCDQDRFALAAAARAFLESYGIRVTPLSIVPSSELCACDGVFFPHPIPNIAYAPTPVSRRESFTLVHEFGHYLVRRNDELLSALHDLDDDAGRIAEERVCHAFAGQILIPDQVVAQVLDGRSPEAHHLRQLVAASSGSLEACAVRLAEHLPSNGYVVIADPVHRCIQFASPSPAAPYRWGRQTHLPEQHPLWRAAATGRFRGQGEVVWTSGSRMNLWLDAVADHGLVHAIFSQTRYWGGAGLSLLDEAPATARPIAISGTCRHCGEATWGYVPCPDCGDVWCRSCGRCGCGAPQPATRVCAICRFEKGKAQFRTKTSTVCRDCE